MQTVSCRMKLTILAAVVVLTIGLRATGISGSIIEAPLNAAVELGQDAIFNCTSDSTTQSWVFSKRRETLRTRFRRKIAIDCVVQPEFTTVYEVERPEGSNHTCNLIVKAATMQEAGVYTCNDTAPGPSAILTVIDADESISVNSSSGANGIVQGDWLTMSYSVRYNSSSSSNKTSTILPVLTWTYSTGKTVEGSLLEAPNSLTSSISVTAGREDIRPYTCHISYEIIGPLEIFANNTPINDSAPISSPTFHVFYGPSTPKIYRSDFENCSIIFLFCISLANPPSNYIWTDISNETDSIEVAYSNVFPYAADNRTYKCEVFNNITNDTGYPSAIFYLEPNSPDLCDGSNSHKPPSGNTVHSCPIAAVASVLGAVLALSAAVNVAAIIFCLRGKTKPEIDTRTETNIYSNEQHIGEELSRGEEKETSEEPELFYEDLGPTGEEQTVYTQLSE